MILAGRRFRPQCRNTSFYFALIRLDRKKFCDESRLDLKIFFNNKEFEINPIIKNQGLRPIERSLHPNLGRKP